MQLGLIDLDNLYVTGDSTKVATYANPHGKRLCSCPKDESCTCPRRYQDVLARWGWDSYRETFVYGHALCELRAYSLDHTVQLPLVISLFDAHRHDSVLGAAMLHEAIDRLHLPIKVASFDMASDALAFYRLGYEHWEIALVIPLNRRNLGHFTYAQATIDEQGVPDCPVGHAMKCWGLCRDRDRIKWRCPLKASRKTTTQQCEHQNPAKWAPTPLQDAPAISLYLHSSRLSERAPLSHRSPQSIMPPVSTNRRVGLFFLEARARRRRTWRRIGGAKRNPSEIGRRSGGGPPGGA